MSVTLPNIFQFNRTAAPARGRLRHAVNMLADALRQCDDATILHRLHETQEAAVLAETRIVELENRLEAMRRMSRVLPMTPIQRPAKDVAEAQS